MCHTVLVQTQHQCVVTKNVLLLFMAPVLPRMDSQGGGRGPSAALDIGGGKNAGDSQEHGGRAGVPVCLQGY